MGNTLNTRTNQYDTEDALVIDLMDMRSKNEQLIIRIRALEDQLTTKDELLCRMEARFEDAQTQLLKKDELILEKEIQRNKSNNDLRNEMNVLKNIITHKDKQIDKYTHTIKSINKLHSQTQEVLKTHLL